MTSMSVLCRFPCDMCAEMFRLSVLENANFYVFSIDN